MSPVRPTILSGLRPAVGRGPRRRHRLVVLLSALSCLAACGGEGGDGAGGGGEGEAAARPDFYYPSRLTETAPETFRARF
ncbi:MAG: hypothetical protein P8188_10915, partial [Gemmatimonadota bacterium]